MRKKPPYSKSALALFWIGAVLVLFAPIKTPLNVYDEGFAVFNATRVMQGDIPYRDFWAIYPPGQFYALAAIFRAFGSNLLAGRIYDTVVRLLIVASGYWITKRLSSSTLLALLASAFSALLLASAYFYAYAVFPALALDLLAILCLLRYMDSVQRHWLVLAGMLIGVASFFRWDIGLYAATSLGMTLILFRLFHPPAQEMRIPNRMISAFAEVTLLVFATLAFALLGYGCVGLASGFGNLWTQVFVFPTTKLHEVRWLPYPKPIPSLSASDLVRWLRFYLPIVVYALAALYELVFLLRRRALDAPLLGIVALTTMGALLFAQALSRYDYIHVVPTTVLVALLVVLLTPRVTRAIHNLALNLVFISLWLALAFGYFSVQFGTLSLPSSAFRRWAVIST